jgi:hypothetical protein
MNAESGQNLSCMFVTDGNDAGMARDTSDALDDVTD